MKAHDFARAVTRAERQRLLCRLPDVALALLIGALMLLPFLCLKSAGAIRASCCRRLDIGEFDFLRWEAGPGFRGSLGRRMLLCGYPALLNIVRGDMAWTGPRPLPVDELVPASVLEHRRGVLPGVFSLWALRQSTSIDFGSEWDVEREQIAQQRLIDRAWLLARCVLVRVYGRCESETCGERRLIDTVGVDSIGMDDALRAIASAVDARPVRPLQVAFVNPDCVNIARRDARYRATVNAADLVLPDGIGMRMAGRLLGRPFRQNVNGTDLFPRLAAYLDRRGGSLYLLGARPGIAELMAARIAASYPSLRILGARDGYLSSGELPQVLADIRSKAPDVLLVAMGAPLQERWIAEHKGELGVSVAIGVGGLFDFWSGRIRRAPQWWRELGLEWIFRLLMEPGRMWRRYLLGNLSFLVAVGLQKILGSADSQQYGSVPGPTTKAHENARGVLMALDLEDEALFAEAETRGFLLPLGDRTVLERSVETLVGLGCKHIDVIADHGLSEIRQLLGCGDRWGVSIQVHAVGGYQAAIRRLRGMDLEDDLPVWLARADHWLPPAALDACTGGGLGAVAHADGGAWSGWACLPGEVVKTVADILLRGKQADRLTAHGLPRVRVEPPYRFDSAGAALASQARWLSGEPGSLGLVPETAPGIRVAPSAKIARDVVLTAPVTVHSGVTIESGARVGPNVNVGEGAFIDRGASLRDAMILPDVYLGRDTTVEEVVVLPEALVSARWRVCLPARRTQNVSGALRAERALPAVSLGERLLAVILLGFTFLPARLIKAPGLRGHFAQTFVPGLPAVIRGKRPLVGVLTPDGLGDAEDLGGWRQRLNGPDALVSPSLLLVCAVPDAGREARAWADIYWLVRHSWRDRLNCLGHYLIAVLRGAH